MSAQHRKPGHPRTGGFVAFAVEGRALLDIVTMTGVAVLFAVLIAGQTLAAFGVITQTHAMGTFYAMLGIILVAQVTIPLWGNYVGDRLNAALVNRRG